MANAGGSARGPYRSGIRRREQIVNAAARAFTAHGYDGASMRQIAADVGVSPAALLRHFQDKEDLLAAVLEWWARETAALGVGERAGLGGFDDLRALMRYHVEHRGLLELFIRLTGEASNEKHPARAFIQERYAKIVGMLVERLLGVARAGEIPPITQGQAESEIRALCATMDGLEIQWLLDPAMDLVGLFDQHLDHTLERWRRGGYVSSAG
ncbi:DNA-binding transcriptional regulator, AcrR family [Nonomuraea solani]|uniref:DNA-binding transcriptional regulator, AcrR family n=1 Tax=Nonomuraea solani TaxID=1144553 RepID=A0A1H6ETE2_9ACTN|nr:TetR/AcrR family transcriptional regulator [Nonomuraea solani]SEH01072.1 DNA-binding transcriptional regulator, AcrR family [Nonomuraea solani]